LGKTRGRSLPGALGSPVIAETTAWRADAAPSPFLLFSSGYIPSGAACCNSCGARLTAGDASIAPPTPPFTRVALYCPRGALATRMPRFLAVLSAVTGG